MLRSLQLPRSGEMDKAVQGCASLRLSSEIQRLDWQRDPAGFGGKMTAELWASNQINAFRDAAKRLVPPMQEIEAKDSERKPRCVVIVMDKRLLGPATPSNLFRKLRRYGTFFPVASDAHGADALRKWMLSRTLTDPEPYAHWYLSGATFDQEYPETIVSLSYDGLRTTCTQLLTMFNRARQSSPGGPDALRQALLYVTPEEMGLGSVKDVVLRTFVLDLFSGGSGTQI